jgi:hypothetical protein
MRQLAVDSNASKCDHINAQQVVWLVHAKLRHWLQTPMGERYLQDVLEGVGHAVDGLKFGSMHLCLGSQDGIGRLLQWSHHR